MRNLLVYSKPFEGHDLLTDRTRPCWGLLLELQEGSRVKALVVRAYGRPAWKRDAHVGHRIFERHHT
jgi:hypothetical protein